MRKTSIVLILLVAVSVAQQTATLKVTGCLISLNGSFHLTTHEGKTYILKGDHDTLLGYGDKLVQVTGTISSSDKSGTVLHVTRVKKLADFCQ